MRKIFINEKTSEKRIAIQENEQVTEIHHSHSSEIDVVGNIYLARVKKVLPGMQAAFVDIGFNQNGYLHRNDLISFQLSDKTEAKSSISHYVREGEQLLVQVVKEGTNQKGPKLTTNIEFGGNLIVFMPYGNYTAVSKKIEDNKERERLLHIANELRDKNEGLLFRTACQQQTSEQLHKEYIQLKQSFLSLSIKQSEKPVCVYEAKSFVDRLLTEIVVQEDDTIICDQIDTVQKLRKKFPEARVVYHEKREGLFSTYNLEQEIEKLFKSIVWLKNGAYIIIEQTEAMTIIDVNTGKFSGKLSMRDTVLQTNRLAAIELAKQIRLRNLSGMILIDFIDMKHTQDQNEIFNTVVNEMKKDRVQHKVIGFTELNILQITRKKVRQPLHASLTQECSICHGDGRVVSAETIAFKLERELWEYQFMDSEALLIEATSDVISLLKGNNDEHIVKLEDTLKYKLVLVEYSNKTPSYHIRHVGDMKTILARIEN
ncbi:Rne/Rng family ribonuclease [Metabacillus litoralis]|uniref:Rne/Rng family ribonuclease n=1 Tax=Metabacillus litoralis TaxID=152268 RepID=UPI001CFC8EC1|nr:ribonuclease E/G [Metabacillus litoralis]